MKKQNTKKALAAAAALDNSIAHRRRGGLYDLGFDDLGVSMPGGPNVQLGLELIGAGVVGAVGMGLSEKAEGFLPAMVKGPKMTPLLRTLAGAAIGVGLVNYADFPGAKLLGYGLGVSLAGSGVLDLVKAFGLLGAGSQAEATMKNGADAEAVNGYGMGGNDELLYGNGMSDAPISITEQQLASAPISVREVSPIEQQLQDMPYLQ